MEVYDVIYFSSPLQDDFIVLHIPGEYDSVLETVFKTEFLTLLSSKYQESLSRQLKVDITSRYDDNFKRFCARCPFIVHSNFSWAFLTKGERYTRLTLCEAPTHETSQTTTPGISSPTLSDTCHILLSSQSPTVETLSCFLRTVSSQLNLH